MNIVTVANRLPVRMGDDGWELSPGGLVTALRPVMAAHSGAWVGWDGGTRGIPATMPDLSVRMLPVGLSASQVRQYYHGFANAALWPLLHDAIEKSRFERAWWHSYQNVNAIFADKAVTALGGQPDALAWVHDYHLMLVPRLIRERCPDQHIGFFLHVPWPPPDIFARLPWRQDVLFGLLGGDVVSFHTEGYRRNFVRTCARLLAGTGVQIHGPHITLPDRRVVTTTSAPISIDAAEFTRLATAPETGRDRSPCPAGTTCRSTATCVPRWNGTSAGSTAGSPNQGPTCRSITCTGGCRRGSLPPTTRPPRRCSSPRSSTG
jgi:trehalose 6-phosphate synthase